MQRQEAILGQSASFPSVAEVSPKLRKSAVEMIWAFASAVEGIPCSERHRAVLQAVQIFDLAATLSANGATEKPRAALVRALVAWRCVFSRGCESKWLGTQLAILSRFLDIETASGSALFELAEELRHAESMYEGGFKEAVSVPTIADWAEAYLARFDAVTGFAFGQWIKPMREHALYWGTAYVCEASLSEHRTPLAIGVGISCALLQEAGIVAPSALRPTGTYRKQWDELNAAMLSASTPEASSYQGPPLPDTLSVSSLKLAIGFQVPAMSACTFATLQQFCVASCH